MRYDLSQLTHDQQLRFLEIANGSPIHEGYYQVCYNGVNNQFVLLRADYVLDDHKKMKPQH